MRIGESFPLSLSLSLFCYSLFFAHVVRHSRCCNLPLTSPLPCSINFNIVSKGLGSDRMSFYLSEAAADVRDLMTKTLEAPKAKL